MSRGSFEEAAAVRSGGRRTRVCGQAAALLACLVNPVLALEPSKAITQYSHSVWQTDEGLPQNTVRAIAQTEDGYLWAGTEAGLVRFDGVRFRVYDRSSDPEVFDNHHIYCLVADPTGPLWIGTNGGGLVRLEDGEFQRIGEAEGLPVGRVTALALGHQNELWIGTYGGGLALLRNGRIDAVFDGQHGLSHPVIFDVAVDAAGTVWVATYGGGLHRLRDGRFESFGRDNGMASDHVWSVHPGREGDLWVGTDAGLHRLRDGKFEVFTTADGLPHDRILSVFEDRDGILWIGTYGGGLCRWIDGSVSSIGRGQGRWTSNNVWTLFEDREGTLWAGTLGGGLHQLKDGPFTTYSLAEGMSSEIVSSLFEDPSGDLWLTTRGGLHRFHDGSFEVSTTADGLASLSSWAVLRDRHGGLWVGHSGAGADYLLDGAWSQYTTRDGLADNTVFAFLEDHRGDFWIGTNAGLNRLREGRFESYTRRNGLAGDQIRALLEDHRQQLWIGTTRGLSRFDGHSFATYTTEEGLSANNVEFLFEASEETLWIATRGGGLNRWRDGELTSFTSRDGLLDDDVSSVVEDADGYLWLSTSRGIFRVAKAELEEFAAGRRERIGGVAYGRRDGLKNEICYGSSLATRDGRLWFTTLDGIAVVDPALVEHTPSPTVVVEQVTADGVVLPPHPQPLAPGVRNLEFRFTAPTLLVPGKIKLRYRLRGFDDEWRQADGRGATSYSNLASGEYTFEVTASDEIGRWTGEVTSYAFRVLPAFHQTMTFYLLCGLSVGLLAWGLHHVRVRRLSRKARELSRQVEQALVRLKILKGLLPICASCKKIRDDDGDWTELETYIDTHSEAQFSHGVCPDCIRKYREFSELVG